MDREKTYVPKSTRRERGNFNKFTDEVWTCGESTLELHALGGTLRAQELGAVEGFRGSCRGSCRISLGCGTGLTLFSNSLLRAIRGLSVWAWGFQNEVDPPRGLPKKAISNPNQHPEKSRTFRPCLYPNFKY